MKVNIKQAQDLTEQVLKAGLVPNLLGSPGVGKSDALRQIGEKYNLELIDFRLTQSDPTDLNGLPTFTEDRKRCDFAAPINLPLENDKIPKGKDGWLLFFDEMTSASQQMQAASYKIVLDRMVGSQNLHKKVMMVCAGNLMSDRAIVNRMSTAMQSRLVHFEIEVSVPHWIKWARDNKLDSRIISFILWRDELLHNFDPAHNEHTYPCPRTWYFVSKLIKNKKEITITDLPLLEGTIGKGASLEFKGFTDYTQHLPSLEDMILHPEMITIPNEPGHKYAITGLISNNYTPENLGSLMKIVNRLPIEFQTITIKNIIGGDEEILDNSPEIDQWCKDNIEELADDID